MTVLDATEARSRLHSLIDEYDGGGRVGGTAEATGWEVGSITVHS